MDTQRLVFIIAETKVLFLWGVAMLAGLRGRFALAQQTAPFLLYSQSITPFIPLQIPIMETSCLVMPRRNARETRKKRCPILFPF